MGLVALWHVGSSQTRDRTCVPFIGRWILNHCTTGKALRVYFWREKHPNHFLSKSFCYRDLSLIPHVIFVAFCLFPWCILGVFSFHQFSLLSCHLYARSPGSTCLFGVLSGQTTEAILSKGWFPRQCQSFSLGKSNQAIDGSAWQLDYQGLRGLWISTSGQW